jgi:excisionase family DNA binding protein
MKIEITLAPEAKDFLSSFLADLQSTMNKDSEVKNLPDDLSEEEPLNVAQAAKIFGVTRQTLSRWTKEGRIKGFTVGGRRYYYLSEIKKALTEQKA